MTIKDCKIENLMKVCLEIKNNDPSDANRQGHAFEFIYGVGGGGITPFEKALFGKRMGDRMVFDVSPAEFCHAMGHLAEALREQTGITASGSLEAVVTNVTRAGDREVVRAMAAGGSCSDCGCGCGGH